ncbi:hypothetical protein [Janthinobacterium sp.]|uniref:hypothetical protein n=1 Tax=Janthinobacterium sp. TaxID=1871054 RepID=UPI00261BDD39|nr:hypothetical protein [Janthinobacterium sp.]
MALKHKIWTIAISVTIVLPLCSWLIYARIESKDWAAWVQAVGSIAAIFFAVVLTWYQSEVAVEREKIKEAGELRGLLLSIRDELSINLQLAQVMVGEQLESTEPGQAFFGIFPVAEKPFNIYNSLCNRLPLITDEVLRLQIIKTYAIAEGAIQTFRFNNKLNADFEIAKKLARKSKSIIDEVEAELIESELMRYGDGLRSHYAQVKKEIEVVLNLLRQIGL